MFFERRCRRRRRSRLRGVLIARLEVGSDVIGRLSDGFDSFTVGAVDQVGIVGLFQRLYSAMIRSCGSPSLMRLATVAVGHDCLPDAGVSGECLRSSLGTQSHFSEHSVLLFGGTVSGGPHTSLMVVKCGLIGGSQHGLRRRRLPWVVRLRSTAGVRGLK